MSDCTQSQDTNLAAVLRRLNPNRPAGPATGAIPRIGRDSQALRLVRTQLGADPRAKILLTGHVGVGKSTELFEMAHSFDPQYFVLFQSVSEGLGAQNANVATVLVLVLAEAARRWEQALGPMPLGLIESVYAVFHRFKGEPASAGHSDIGALIASLVEEKYQKVVRSGKELQELLNLVIQRAAFRLLKFQDQRTEDVSDLAMVCEGFLKEMQAAAQKPLLVLLDDLDKIVEEEAAVDIFIERAMGLCRLPCAVLATMPINLYLHDRAGELEQIWNNVSILDPLDIPSASGDKLEEPALTFYLSLLKQVGGQACLSARQVRRLARDSGGIPRIFVQLCAASLTYAIQEHDQHVRDWHLDVVESDWLAKFQARLFDADYRALDRVVRTQSNVPDAVRLIREGILIMRKDEQGKRTFEPNPLSERLLKDYRRRQSESAVSDQDRPRSNS